ncbi:hypothetical protein OUZ56_000127 [Daphnia magna]|uniref:Thioredoxin domain-containing protein n=1 Tax=Daphnia magna TaxID=35525 RepID=A0ABQ9ZYS4_9CRUS|nr:hypothetical protein OUZ56_000127 [Daphnia magna]
MVNAACDSREQLRNHDDFDTCYHVLPSSLPKLSCLTTQNQSNVAVCSVVIRIFDKQTNNFIQQSQSINSSNKTCWKTNCTSPFNVTDGQSAMPNQHHSQINIRKTQVRCLTKRAIDSNQRDLNQNTFLNSNSLTSQFQLLPRRMSSMGLKDFLRAMPPKDTTGSLANAATVEAFSQIAKVIAYIVTFCIFLTGAVIAKGTLLFMTSQIKITDKNRDVKHPYCSTRAGREIEASVSMEERVGWVWAIFFCFVVPEFFMWFRSTRICLFRTWKRPTTWEFFIIQISPLGGHNYYACCLRFRLVNPRNFIVGFLILFKLFSHGECGAVQLTADNFDSIIANTELVLINFYADFSRVVLGKVDCDKETSIGTRFHISEYPTLKAVRNGQLFKKE